VIKPSTPNNPTEDNDVTAYDTTSPKARSVPREPLDGFHPIVRQTFGACEYERRDLSIKDPQGRVVWEQKGVEVPKHWSNTAANVLAQKYFRRKGVPSSTRTSNPDADFFSPRGPAAGCTFGGETSAHQVFHRLAGAWTYEAQCAGLICEGNTPTFYDEIMACLEWQVASPNSPQWFNTGLFWAYGITGRASGHYATHPSGETFACRDAYSYPQASACFIQSVKDDLVNEGGIMDLWGREARVFKYGSGSGVDVSPLRGKGEPMSGGGVSSGLLSFLKIGDAVGGAIASGGTTRRAAKMLVLNVDHPDIEDFIAWKQREEDKVAGLVAGSQLVRGVLAKIAAAAKNSGPTSPAVRACVQEGEALGVPSALLVRAVALAKQGLEAQVEGLDADWQGEAYRTVSGQNSNNSVRVTRAFLEAVERDEAWTLTRRTDGQPHKTVKARALWEQMGYAAWVCADPGLQFDDVIQDWHTCPASGRINASNPCVEFMFLDDTACNLASINLLRVITPDAADHEKDARLFYHVARLWTVVLEATVGMSGYPTREIAARSHAFRPLGLGFANLGALIMRLGLEYGSTEAQLWARAVAGLITGAAYEASADLARAAGPFAGLAANRPHMERVLEQHHAALGYTILGPESESYPRSRVPFHRIEVKTEEQEKVWHRVEPLMRYADDAFLHARHKGSLYGWRNAQASVCAPTGTIALQMDCDTTGIEPPFALKAHKELAGGGWVELVNESVPHALRALGWFEAECGIGQDHVPGIKEACAWIKERGDLEGFAQAWPDFAPEIEQAQRVLLCANPARPGGPCLAPEAHLLMMAACQPLLSGAISKSVNLPASATVADVIHTHERAAALHLKAVALYRDGSKLSQPMKAWQEDEQDQQARQEDDGHEEDAEPLWGAEDAQAVRQIMDDTAPHPTRERLPSDCQADRYRREIGGHVMYFHVGRYEDGRVGEIFLKLAKEGSALNALGDALTQVVSVALQHGVPLDTLARIFEGTRFEPAGLVRGSRPLPTSDPIHFATSPLDLLGRELLRHYCAEPAQAPAPRQEAAPQEPLGAFGAYMKRDELPLGFALWQAKMQAKGLTLAPTTAGQLCQWEEATRQAKAEPQDAQASGQHPARSHKASGDPCRACGNFTLVRAGSCYACKTCGETTGCS